MDRHGVPTSIYSCSVKRCYQEYTLTTDARRVNASQKARLYERSVTCKIVNSCKRCYHAADRNCKRIIANIPFNGLHGIYVFIVQCASFTKTAPKRMTFVVFRSIIKVQRTQCCCRFAGKQNKCCRMSFNN